MSEIVIRLATRDDVAAVHQLLVDLAVELDKSAEIRGTEQNLLDYGFSDTPRFEAMLAFEQDTAIGLVVFFSEYSTWRGVPGVYVQDLYIAAEARGLGLGRRLLEAVRIRSREWGGEYMKLTVYDRNPQAIAFYQRLGFDLREDELPLVLRYF